LLDVALFWILQRYIKWVSWLEVIYFSYQLMHNFYNIITSPLTQSELKTMD
jgi:hypothetical protein